MGFPDIPFKDEVYSVAARPLTPSEVEQVYYETERNVRIWFEDPRGWTLDGFIGFHVSAAMFRFQLSQEQARYVRDKLREDCKADLPSVNEGGK
jgi:hypothetical protein